MTEFEVDYEGVPKGIPTNAMFFTVIKKLREDYFQFKDETNKRLAALERKPVKIDKTTEKKVK
jgi:hypothetical protein